MHLSEQWESDAPSARVIRALLWPASCLYALGWQTYLGVYRAGIKKAKAPHSPVICVGNLVVGGTGKSPVTVFMAELLKDMGHEVVISASGYGSPASEAANVAPEGALNASEWGDEPAMLRMLLPDVPLIVGRRRVLAAELCHQHFPKAVLLMDDGFQHLPLSKGISIVLDPPGKNSFCLPAGPYREPRRNGGRADLLIPGEFNIERQPTKYSSGADLAPQAINGEEVAVLTALGSPSQFIEAVRESGLQIKESRLLPDHDPLDAGNLFDGLPNLPIVVTLKDWVKLRERPDAASRPIWVARQHVRIAPEDKFRRWLAARLDERTQD